MAHIYILRHGEPLRPEGAFYTGSGGDSFFCPLTKLGRGQVMNAVEKLPSYGFEAIYASPLLRTLETAGYAARKLNLPIHIDDRLREINYGRFEMMGPRQMEEQYPELYKSRMEDPYHFQYPDGETLEEVAKRALPAFEEIDRRHEGPVLIAGHAGVTFACIWASGKNKSGVFYDHFFNFAQICDYTEGVYPEEDESEIPKNHPAFFGKSQK